MADLSTDLWFKRAATRGDIAFALADIVIAVRTIQIAFLAMKSGDSSAFDQQILKLDEQCDKIWNRYLELVGEDG